jgi:hypothetical protein
MRTSVPQTRPPGTGWNKWQWRRPTHLIVETWRREWQEIKVVDVRELHPAVNIWDLHWRPVAQGGEPIH